MITINLKGINHQDLEFFAKQYAVSYFAGFPITPIIFLEENEQKKKHFYKIFRLMVKQLVEN